MNNNKELADELEKLAEILNPLGSSLVTKAAQALRGEESGAPEMGQEYWWINGIGEVCSSVWDNNETDQLRLACGNVYMTEEQAETIAENRKTLVKLRKFGCKDGGYAFYINHKGNVSIGEIHWCFGEPVSFASKEQAQQALEAVGEDKVKLLIEWGVL